MNQNIAVIKQYPATFSEPLDRAGFSELLQRIGDGADMAVVLCAADDKMLGDTGLILEVENEHTLGFFIDCNFSERKRKAHGADDYTTIRD